MSITINNSHNKKEEKKKKQEIKGQTGKVKMKTKYAMNSSILTIHPTINHANERTTRQKLTACMKRNNQSCHDGYDKQKLVLSP